MRRCDGAEQHPAVTTLNLHRQLELYARDLKRVLADEEERSRQLEMANRQLQAYAQDLKSALHAERQQSRELERSYHDTILRLLAATRCRDHETGEHVVRIAHYARRLALCTGWAGPDAELLSGSRSPLIEMARQIALTHHERWDGTGYPHNLKGLAIPLAGRIVMLVDQYDALRTKRPYKPALSHRQTCQVMLEGDGRTLPRHFDPLLLAAFRDIHQEFGDIYAIHSDDPGMFTPSPQAETAAAAETA